MRRIISNSEYYYGSLLLVSVLFILSYAINSEVVMYVILFSCCLFVVIIVSDRFRAGKGLPSKCKRNYQGYIEVHVENDCDKKIENLFRILCEVIEIGKSEKKDVLVDSWLISKKNIEKYLGESVEFLSVSIIQRVSNKIHRLIFKAQRGKNIEPYRCIIKTSLVSKEQMVRIQNKITQIDLRRNRIG